jgi:putative transposase
MLAMLPRRQTSFQFRTWGGARAGAGRRPNGSVAGVSHLRRPALARQHPVHVTLRVQRGLASLREQRVFVRVRESLARARERFGFRLVHFSVQRDHLHLVAEASDRRALARGVQGLSIRVARAVNRQLERKGRVFADRYHARALKTPRAVRMAVRYVLLNARKHERGRSSLPSGFVDSRSSAPWFAGFSRPLGLTFGAHEARAAFEASSREAAPVVAARTWLLRAGLRRAGPFDIDDVPSG